MVKLIAEPQFYIKPGQISIAKHDDGIRLIGTSLLKDAIKMLEAEVEKREANGDSFKL